MMYRDEPKELLATAAPDDVKLLSICRVFDAEIKILREADEVLLLPEESVIELDATDTEPVPPVGPVGVYVTVLDVPEVVSDDNVPRVAVKSERARSVTLSLNVMVMVHAVPAA
jgi:hypothetical protein